MNLLLIKSKCLGLVAYLFELVSRNAFNLSLIQFIFYSHLTDVQNDKIRPMTQSKFDKSNVSNYNHCYSSLLTVDELRELNRQKMKKANFKY